MNADSDRGTLHGREFDNLQAEAHYLLEVRRDLVAELEGRGHRPPHDIAFNEHRELRTEMIASWRSRPAEIAERLDEIDDRLEQIRHRRRQLDDEGAATSN